MTSEVDTPGREGDDACMNTASHIEIVPGDVVRARRLGNRTVGNYVIDEVARVSEDTVAINNSIAVYAHREYGGGRGRFMVLDLNGARVVRNYR